MNGGIAFGCAVARHALFDAGQSFGDRRQRPVVTRSLAMPCIEKFGDFRQRARRSFARPMRATIEGGDRIFEEMFSVGILSDIVA